MLQPRRIRRTTRTKPYKFLSAKFVLLHISYSLFSSSSSSNSASGCIYLLVVILRYIHYHFVLHTQLLTCLLTCLHIQYQVEILEEILCAPNKMQNNVNVEIPKQLIFHLPLTQQNFGSFSLIIIIILSSILLLRHHHFHIHIIQLYRRIQELKNLQNNFFFSIILLNLNVTIIKTI